MSKKSSSKKSKSNASAKDNPNIREESKSSEGRKKTASPSSQGQAEKGASILDIYPQKQSPDSSPAPRKHIHECGCGCGDAQEDHEDDLFHDAFRDICAGIAMSCVFGDPSDAKAHLDPILDEFQKAGFELKGPILKILQGERDIEKLIEGLQDLQTIALVRQLAGSVEALHQFAQRRREFLATFPEEFQQACEGEDEDAVDVAYESLPPSEQKRFFEGLAQLQEEFGLPMGGDEDDEDDEGLDSLIDDIASVALGEDDPTLREELDDELIATFGEGNPVVLIIRRIWEGERDGEVLTENVEDDQMVDFINEILERIEEQ